MKSLIKSEKGVFTILSVLLVALFVEFLLLNLHKNINSFMEMEKTRKQQLSQGKLKQIILNSLLNEKACRNTFKNTNQDVTLIKGFDGKTILDLSVSDKDFYKKSGFYEKTNLRVKAIKIIEQPPENYKDYKSQAVKNLSLDREEHPQKSGLFHSVATMRMHFSKGKEQFFIYAPIYIAKKSGRIQTCSTSEEQTQKLNCEKQNITVICCRYIYNLTLDPQKHGGKFKVGKDYTEKARPGDPEQVGLTETREDPEKTRVQSDCQGEKTVAKAIGICDFEYNWSLKTSCHYP